MSTKEITWQVPEELYNEMLRAKETYALPDLAELIQQAVQYWLQEFQRQAYQQELEKLQQEIQAAGGTAAMGLGTTKEEIITNLRRTRQQIYEEDYANLYR